MTCSIDWCDRKAVRLTWCLMHYTRNRRGQDMNKRPIGYKTMSERLAAYTDKTADCWLWTGALDTNGYGKVSTDGGGKALAHRASYEHHIGPIAPGLVIDHLCRNPTCVNPAHLRATTLSINTRDGLLGFGLTGMCRALLHDMTNPANVLNKTNGERQCHPCLNAARRKHDKAKRAAAKMEQERNTESTMEQSDQT